MRVKPSLSRVETSPVKLRDDAEKVLKVFSPTSPIVQFRRKLHKYKEVVSPELLSRASNIAVCYTCTNPKPCLRKLDNTLAGIKVELDRRIVEAFSNSLDQCLIESQRAFDTARKKLNEEKAANARARVQAKFRSRYMERSRRAKALAYAGGRMLNPLAES